MNANLTFVKSPQGWNSTFEDKLVVADNYLAYRLSADNQETHYVRLEEVSGFYVAHFL